MNYICRGVILLIKKLTLTSVGADLSSTPPIHRPKCASPRIILFSFVILSLLVCHPERSEGSHALGRDASLHSA
jgi:hypothetical protein